MQQIHLYVHEFGNMNMAVMVHEWCCHSPSGQYISSKLEMQLGNNLIYCTLTA